MYIKARISQSEIDYIKDKVNQYGNVSIYFGQLSLGMIEKLSKHFRVTKEYFGYYQFQKLN